MLSFFLNPLKYVFSSSSCCFPSSSPSFLLHLLYSFSLIIIQNYISNHKIASYFSFYFLYILYILFFHLIIFYFKFLFLSYFLIIDCLSESIELSIGQQNVVVVVISLHLHNSDFDVTNICFIILVIYLNALFW